MIFDHLQPKVSSIPNRQVQNWPYNGIFYSSMLQEQKLKIFSHTRWNDVGNYYRKAIEVAVLCFGPWPHSVLKEILSMFNLGAFKYTEFDYGISFCTKDWECLKEVKKAQKLQFRLLGSALHPIQIYENGSNQNFQSFLDANNRILMIGTLVQKILLHNFRDTKNAFQKLRVVLGPLSVNSYHTSPDVSLDLNLFESLHI